MELGPETTQSTSQAPARFDVLIVGAGISGIDAAYHLQQECPEKSFALLEKQTSFGGTWITHKFPGIRSDSDLYTYGYSWKPWSSAPIATAEEILAYLDEVLDEQNIRQRIHFHHDVKSARWSSEDKCWTLEVERKDTRETLRFTCNFLWMCQGYYRHSEGYTPDFPGVQRFQGQIVHPQSWPQNLEYQGKVVLVIGSGATAATLVPAMAEHAAHITMLQRSPTYYFPAANRTEIADLLRTLDVPEEWVHEITRRKVLQDQKTTIHRSFHDSQALKEDLIAAARAYLGEDFDVETHFTPSYRPWRQRLCFLPDGDLFRSIKAGKASVVTDHIETFTEKGVMLMSGKEVEADIIVTATGLNLCALGDIDFTINGQPLNFAECWGHRGILFSGVPNMAWVFGYLRASWTLRADLVAQFVCRLLNYMTEKGAAVVTPQLRAQDQDMAKLPWVDPENFNAGYLMRSMHIMPKQGDREPWIFSQDYQREKDEIPAADLEDGTLLYQ